MVKYKLSQFLFNKVLIMQKKKSAVLRIFNKWQKVFSQGSCVLIVEFTFSIILFIVQIA